MDHQRNQLHVSNDRRLATIDLSENEPVEVCSQIPRTTNERINVSVLNRIEAVEQFKKANPKTIVSTIYVQSKKMILNIGRTRDVIRVWRCVLERAVQWEYVTDFPDDSVHTGAVLATNEIQVILMGDPIRILDIQDESNYHITATTIRPPAFKTLLLARTGGKARQSHLLIAGLARQETVKVPKELVELMANYFRNQFPMKLHCISQLSKGVIKHDAKLVFC